MHAGEWLDALASQEAQEFMRANENEDPFSLSLRFQEIAGIPISILASQIRSRQKARTKLPEWASHDCIVFPPAENLEQASSEQTARFKSTLIRGDRFVDLTGGSGIDSFYISQNFRSSIYVEEQPELCAIAEHNFRCLNQEIEVLNLPAERFLEQFTVTKEMTFFLDPSRRDSDKRRVFRLEDCSPDARKICAQISEQNGHCLLKLSPMLDIEQARRELLNRVAKIWIVALDGEVKELLFLTQPQPEDNPLYTATDLNLNGGCQQFEFRRSEEENAYSEYTDSGLYLYESSAALRKAGAFKILSGHFNLKKVAPNTHLYFSGEFYPDFQGRVFRVLDILPYQPKKLSSRIGSEKANITIRNFPEEVAQIRRRSKLRDGGDLYLFCYTDQHDRKMVAVCKKA
ncbi:class I SAM-dependent methyltransferase [Fulvivirga sedimenti]|uniref:Class I SAM-dependent methyltransferase n=1 Tax=Fulvivirga sedimenti TaxID=2879465 RepID=A0A9X1HXG3_9BACT|nr:class I SAM-dependent methyltransferase [Fulvivirga sedimenti]MCA6078552.1 class I SAM-dependent methyltransferase [Fulvivirga sedimenti]